MASVPHEESAMRNLLVACVRCEESIGGIRFLLGVRRAESTGGMCSL